MLIIEEETSECEYKYYKPIYYRLIDLLKTFLAKEYNRNFYDVDSDTFHPFSTPRLQPLLFSSSELE